MCSANLGRPFAQRRDSESVALIDLSFPDKPRKWAFRDLEHEADRFAQLVLDRGMGKGGRVALFGYNSAPYYCAYLGIIRAGCVAVPVNIKMPAELIDFVCRDASVDLVIVDPDVDVAIPADIARIDLATTENPTGNREYETSDTELAEILYTSGSTGKPKGVLLSHRSQRSMVDAMAATGKTPPFAGRVGLIAAPLFHMNAQLFLAAILAHGGTAVLMSRFDVATFSEALVRYSVQLITGVPTMVVMLYQDAEPAVEKTFESVETVYIGSAPVTDAIIQQAHELFPGAEVINSYGTTETGGGLFGKHPDGKERPEKAVGFPLPHAELRLVDQDDDGRGVLEVRAPSNMDGYLNLPELTAKKIRDGWINTGDIFATDENGFFYYVGRADDMFVCNGENVFPGMLEKLIESRAGVVQAAVVPIEDEKRGMVPVAFVVAESDADLSEADIRQYVLDRSTPNMHPRKVWFLRQLPLAATNKVDKKRLQEQAKQKIA